jgi:hypothetical protein
VLLGTVDGLPDGEPLDPPLGEPDGLPLEPGELSLGWPEGLDDPFLPGWVDRELGAPGVADPPGPAVVPTAPAVWTTRDALGDGTWPGVWPPWVEDPVGC